MGEPSLRAPLGAGQRLLYGAHLVAIIALWVALLPLMALVALVDACWTQAHARREG